MSTKEYGCFFCSGKSINRSGQCDVCSEPIDVSAYLLGADFAPYRIVGILGRGFFGWTAQVKDEYQDFSAKVIPIHRLDGEKLADKEIRALIACSPHANIARFIRQLPLSLSFGGRVIEVLCLVFEFIPGAHPLREIIADDTVVLSRSDVAAILAGIASGLARMHARELWHHDLHDDNVLVRRVEPDENLRGDYQPKLIDFGSTKPLRADEPEARDRGDYVYLAKHILELAMKFERDHYGALTPADRRFLKLIRVLAQQVGDKHVSRRNLTPMDVVREIQNALEQCSTGQNFPAFDEMKQQVDISFNDPLANSNALTMAPQDVARLFRDSLGWEARIEKSEPVFVLGPRGCGKTMLLRYLSIESQARPRKAENTSSEVQARLAATPHVAFLVSIGQIRTPFIRSAFKRLQEMDVHLAEDFCRECISAHFVYEVLRTILWLHGEQLIPIRNDDLDLLSGVSTELAGTPANASGRRAARLEEIAEQLDRRVTTLSSLPDPASYRSTNLSGDDVLLKLARGLRSTSWGRTKEIWFLLDDYSVTMLPPIAQRAYNPVLFRLSREVRVKVSSEGDGPILEDTLGRKYIEGRELTKVNLGEIYFQKTEVECRQFFGDILDARFREIGKGSLSGLLKILGEHASQEGFGDYILRTKRPGDARFYGFGVLCSLCSGDVSFIIELLHSLVGSRDTEQAAVLRPKQQDDIIKRFAQRQLGELRSISDNGPKLYEFAEHLGNLLKRYLLNTHVKSNPDERLRIEVEGTGEISSEARLMEDSLLRHSVLIPGGAGKSKQGLPTRRLFPRRLFAPCFPFSPARKGCIDLTVQEYEQWLLDPATIEQAGPKPKRLPPKRRDESAEPRLTGI
jgi:Protein kinase domain